MNSIVTSLFSIANVGRLQVSLEELACTFLVSKNSCQLMLINELVALALKSWLHVPMSTSSDQITSPSNLLEAKQQS
jgi:hypothetical protein